MHDGRNSPKNEIKTLTQAYRYLKECTRIEHEETSSRKAQTKNPDERRLEAEEVKRDKEQLLTNLGVVEPPAPAPEKTHQPVNVPAAPVEPVVGYLGEVRLQIESWWKDGKMNVEEYYEALGDLAEIVDDLMEEIDGEQDDVP
jgi:hypothetical protein